ncbi:hypothetical protein DL93DRAFT_2167924 [Clavulina sp. PMI_390]|nr:hypothetical protein DL93DRAFT_2167924 [Clavulina sp. PMI_390]
MSTVSHAASTSAPSFDDLVRSLGSGQPFVSSFNGTSDYNKDTPSAYGLAAMNSIRQIFMDYSHETREDALLRVIHTYTFHEEVANIASFLKSQDQIEINDIHKLPIFAHAMKLLREEYSTCSLDSFKSILARLAQESAQGSPVGAVITRSADVVAITRIPLAPPPADHSLRDEQCDQTFVPHTHAYALFDLHSREPHHPNGSAFILFPTPEQAAEYLSDLLKVDETLNQSHDSRQTRFSAHIFTPRSDETGHTTASSVWAAVWAMLYETSVELVEVKRERDELVRNAERLRGELRDEKARGSTRDGTRDSEALDSAREGGAETRTSSAAAGVNREIRDDQQPQFSRKDQTSSTLHDDTAIFPATGDTEELISGQSAESLSAETRRLQKREAEDRRSHRLAVRLQREEEQQMERARRLAWQHANMNIEPAQRAPAARDGGQSGGGFMIPGWDTGHRAMRRQDVPTLRTDDAPAAREGGFLGGGNTSPRWNTVSGATSILGSVIGLGGGSAKKSGEGSGSGGASGNGGVGRGIREVPSLNASARPYYLPNNYPPDADWGRRGIRREGDATYRAAEGNLLGGQGGGRRSAREDEAASLAYALMLQEQENERMMREAIEQSREFSALLGIEVCFYERFHHSN